MKIKIELKNTEQLLIECDNFYYRPTLDCFSYIKKEDAEVKTILVKDVNFIYIEK